MTSAFSTRIDLQLAAYSAELRAFLEGLPARLRSGRLEKLRADCKALYDRAPEAAGQHWERVRAALADLRQALESGAARAYALAKYEEAARAYEQWTAARRAGHASLKPLKGARTYFHMAMGVLASVLYQFVLTQKQAVIILVALCATFVSLEITRRIFARWNDVLVNTVFKQIVRPREYYEINSATWYLAALSILTPVFDKPALLAGVLVLAFGDPAAAWVGKAIRSRKLHGNKSLAGTLAFVAAGFIAAAAWLMLFTPQLPLSRRVLGAAAAALAGAVAELYSDRLDDNLTVPIAAVLAASLLV